MREELVVAGVIALSGLLAAGNAVHEGLKDPPKGGKPFDPDSIRCASPYEPVAPGRRAMTVAVVGDAVTAWKPPADASTSWVTYLRGNGVRVVQDWVDPTAHMTELADQVGVARADVLVVLAGTNDVRADRPKDEVELALQRIVDRTGADRVLLSSIPPVPRQLVDTADFNDLLARIAYRHDWSFVDSAAAIIDDNCSYSAGLGGATARPTAEGARVIGETIQGVLTSRAVLDPDRR